VLTPKDTLSIAYSVLTENQKKRFEIENELDFSSDPEPGAVSAATASSSAGCVSPP